MSHDVIGILKEASRLIYQNTKDMAGTPDAAGDYGVGAGGDVSRKIDIIAEKTVLDFLERSGLPCVVLGEECGRVELSEDPAGYVIMDAIDGSANAVRGVPFFCSSLAFATGDRLSTVSAGVVTDLSNGDMYWATAEGGAYMNGTPIHVRDEDPIYRIVGVNLSWATPDLTAKMQPLFEDNNHIRHFGANALEMAFFARGLLDAFVDIRGMIRIQDIAAGYIIAREAGGILLDEQMRPLDAGLDYETRISFVMAANKDALDSIVSGMGWRATAVPP